MNTSSPVVSALAKVNLNGKEHHLVKLTSTGIDLAASTDAASVIGTVARGNIVPLSTFVANTQACDVFIKDATPLPFAVLGAGTSAIARGDQLEIDASNPGQLNKKASGTAVAIAWDAAAAPVQGGLITVKLL